MSGSQAFLAHTAHVEEGMSGGFGCTECHREPLDVLSTDHAFDNTPGRAEVGFALGLSTLGVYNGAGACSTLYCHGNGQEDNGSAVDGSAPMLCNSCHPGMNSGENAWKSMSGKHEKHLSKDYTCGNCHLEVTDDGFSILQPQLHVDGANQIDFTDTRINYDPDNGRCSGNCHGENHSNKNW